MAKIPRRRNIMFTNPADSHRLVKEKQRDLRREAEAYRLAKELNGQQTGPSTSIKVGLALIGIIALVVAGQFAIA
jgi:hypothetical protein